MGRTRPPLSRITRRRNRTSEAQSPEATRSCPAEARGQRRRPEQEGWLCFFSLLLGRARPRGRQRRKIGVEAERGRPRSRPRETSSDRRPEARYAERWGKRCDWARSSTSKGPREDDGRAQRRPAVRAIHAAVCSSGPTSQRSLRAADDSCKAAHYSTRRARRRDGEGAVERMGRAPSCERAPSHRPTSPGPQFFSLTARSQPAISSLAPVFAIITKCCDSRRLPRGGARERLHKRRLPLLQAAKAAGHQFSTTRSPRALIAADQPSHAHERRPQIGRICRHTYASPVNEVKRSDEHGARAAARDADSAHLRPAGVLGSVARFVLVGAGIEQHDAALEGTLR